LLVKSSGIVEKPDEKWIIRDVRRLRYDSDKALIRATDHGSTDRATRIPPPNESGDCRCFFAANGWQIAQQRGDNRSSGPLFRRAQN
jgi:hypothetical protein